MRAGNKNWASRDPEQPLSDGELVELMGEFGSSGSYKSAAKRVGCSEAVAFRAVFSRVGEDEWAHVFEQARMALAGVYWALAQGYAEQALKTMGDSYGKTPVISSGVAAREFDRITGNRKAGRANAARATRTSRS